MVEAGLFGGAGRGQGRKPKNRTASEQVAELATQEARSIKKAFSDGLRSKNERTRLLAAKDLLAEERREIERNESEAFYRRMSDAELNAALFEMLDEALCFDLSAMTADRVVDAEVVEDDPANDFDIESALAELGVPIEKTENVSAPPPRQFGLRAWPRATE
jgi:hypothetical protein